MQGLKSPDGSSQVITVSLGMVKIVNALPDLGACEALTTKI